MLSQIICAKSVVWAYFCLEHWAEACSTYFWHNHTNISLYFAICKWHYLAYRLKGSGTFSYMHQSLFYKRKPSYMYEKLPSHIQYCGDTRYPDHFVSSLPFTKSPGLIIYLIWFFNLHKQSLVYEKQLTRKGNAAEKPIIWLSFSISDHLAGSVPLKRNICKSTEDLQLSVEEFWG